MKTLSFVPLALLLAAVPACSSNPVGLFSFDASALLGDGSDLGDGGPLSDGGNPNDGGAVDSGPEEWRTMSTVNAPSKRNWPVAVWTGKEMIVWGGETSDISNPTPSNAGRYNPSTDTWTQMAAHEGIVGCAVWTGKEIIAATARFDPATSTWSPLPMPAGIVTGAGVCPVAWTGTEVLTWDNDATGTTVGHRFNPSTNQWKAMSTDNQPPHRLLAAITWTGTELVLWGGEEQSLVTNAGWRYRPSDDSWRMMSQTNAPEPRVRAGAVWTGSEVVVWGGTQSNTPFINVFYQTGGRYDPVTDSWAPMTTANAPDGLDRAPLFWTGTEVLVWGGNSAYNGFWAYTNTGARYNPATNTWTHMTPIGAPDHERMDFAAVWTGNDLLVWSGWKVSTLDGGGETYAWLSSGGRYHP